MWRWSHSWSLRSVAQRRVTVPGLCRGLHARRYQHQCSARPSSEDWRDLETRWLADHGLLPGMLLSRDSWRRELVERNNHDAREERGSSRAVCCDEWRLCRRRSSIRFAAGRLCRWRIRRSLAAWKWILQWRRWVVWSHGRPSHRSRGCGQSRAERIRSTVGCKLQHGCSWCNSDAIRALLSSRQPIVWPDNNHLLSCLAGLNRDRSTPRKSRLRQGGAHTRCYAESSSTRRRTGDGQTQQTCTLSQSWQQTKALSALQKASESVKRKQKVVFVFAASSGAARYVMAPGTSCTILHLRGAQE